MVSSVPARRGRPKRRVAKAPGVGSLRGHGNYSYDKPGPWGQYGRKIGERVGHALLGGSVLGKAIAGDLGGKIGSYSHYIGKIFGSGDYVTGANAVKANVLVNESQVPQFGSSNNTVHVRHREYLGDIITSSSASTFQVQSFAINPGQASSFPWLSQLCGSTFQQYRINGMVFEFRTMSADALNSTNTALGSVIMATDYDSADGAFNSKQQMENTEFGVSCKPSSCMIHAIECARSQTSVSELYVRPGNVPSGADIRLYDLGKFYIATTGFQGTSVNVGELWVSYDITFFKGILQAPGLLIPTYRLSLAASAAATPLLPYTSSATYPTGLIYDSIGMSSNGTTSVSFPVSIPVNSLWMVVFAVRGSSTASIVSPTITGSNGMVVSYQWQVDTSSGYNAPQTATGTTLLVINTFKYNGSGTPGALPTLAFSTGGTFPSAANGDLYITMVNGNGPNS